MNTTEGNRRAVTRQGITEADLLRALSRPIRVERCACGSEIAARAEDWEDIADAIYAHNATDRHLAWRSWVAA